MRLHIVYRTSPVESWHRGHRFAAGTSRELAETHAEAIALVLSRLGCPDAEVRVSETIF